MLPQIVAMQLISVQELLGLGGKTGEMELVTREIHSYQKAAVQGSKVFRSLPPLLLFLPQTCRSSQAHKGGSTDVHPGQGKERIQLTGRQSHPSYFSAVSWSATTIPGLHG